MTLYDAAEHDLPHSPQCPPGCLRCKTRRELEYQKVALDQHTIVATTDAAGRIDYVNDHFCRVTGYSRDELVGADHRLLSSGTHPAEFFAGMWTTISTGAIWRGVLHNRAKNGAELWMKTLIIPLTDEQGLIFKYFAVSTDITALKVSEQSLRAERDRFQGILGAMHEGVLLLDEQGTIEFHNAHLAELLQGECQGRSFFEVFPGVPGLSEVGQVAVITEGGRGFLTEWMPTPRRTFEFSITPSRASSASHRLIVLVRDVTEKKTLQAEAIRNAHLASLGELAAGIAHEINNPINGIINYGQMLEDLARLEGPLADVPRRIINEGDRIASIVSNLLDFARNRKEEHTPTNLADVVRASLELCQRQLAKDGIIVEVEATIEGCLRGRNQQLQQVVLNLLSNARYALNRRFPEPHPAKRLSLRLSEDRMAGSVELRLRDQGTGIPAELLDRICDPFFTSKPRGEGTGLGLSISHGIVSDHGGTMGFDSVEGDFTEVRLSFPRLG